MAGSGVQLNYLQGSEAADPKESPTYHPLDEYPARYALCWWLPVWHPRMLLKRGRRIPSLFQSIQKHPSTSLKGPHLFGFSIRTASPSHPTHLIQEIHIANMLVHHSQILAYVLHILA